MIFERRAHTLTEVYYDENHSYIYAIGSSLPNESMNKCEVYNVAKDEWTQVPNLNTKRNFHSSIAFHNRFIYVVAGFNGGQRTNLIEKLDLKKVKMQWEILNLRVKENCNWICLEGCGLHAIAKDKILIFGGFTTSDQKTNECFIFNVNTNEIEQEIIQTRTYSNFYQRQPKLGSDGRLYCVETNTLDLHVYDLTRNKWDIIARRDIGW
jgi:N-acetylneuraminic acid mutarotase